MSAEEVANAFVQHFYNSFDNGSAEQLGALFVSEGGPAMTRVMRSRCARRRFHARSFILMFFLSQRTLFLLLCINYAVPQFNDDF
jgi:hypothetical protein